MRSAYNAANVKRSAYIARSGASRNLKRGCAARHISDYTAYSVCAENVCVNHNVAVNVSCNVIASARIRTIFNRYIRARLHIADNAARSVFGSGVICTVKGSQNYVCRRLTVTYCSRAAYKTYYTARIIAARCI